MPSPIPKKPRDNHNHDATYLKKKGDTMTGNLILNDQTIYLRGDPYHGIGWYGTEKKFSNTAVDGPVVYGVGGGALGSDADDVQKIALGWDNNQNVAVNGNLSAKNLPGVAWHQEGSGHHSWGRGDQGPIDELYVNVPAHGYLFITAFVQLESGGEFSFDLYVAGTQVIGTKGKSMIGTLSLSYVQEVKEGVIYLRSYGHHVEGSRALTLGHNLSAVYLPVDYTRR